VRHWVNHFAQHGNIQDETHAGGPRYTDEAADTNIAVVARVEKFVTPKRIAAQLDLECSPRTVRRRLNEAGLFGRISREEYAFTENDLRRRLAFAEGYKHWTSTDWERVIFSDEVHIEVGKHGRRWVQRPVGTAFNPEYTYQQDEATEQVTLWGCFCAKEIGQAEIFIGEFDARKYVGILRANLIPSYRKFFPSGQWYFQQDNAPQHTSAAARAWFHNNGITVLDFPPWSPDLNPIENLWADFKQRVEQHHALTAEELETAMKVEWEGTDNSLLTKLVHSMPDRLSQFINNKEHTTKY
jgi:hypothetical protein